MRAGVGVVRAASACRIATMRPACAEKSPWEKFSRAMFMPARMSRSSISGDWLAGPIVATILVLCVGRDMAAIIPRHART